MTRRTQPGPQGQGSLPVTALVTAPFIPAQPRAARFPKETEMHHMSEQMARSHMAARHAEAQASRVVRVAKAARRAAAAERRARMAREAAVMAAHQAVVVAAR